MIRLACPSCGRNLRVKDELAGKQGVCPYCRQRVNVPASAPTELFDAGTLSPAADLDGEALDFLAPPQGPGELGRLGAYRIVKVLGVGGMGMVLQAEDMVLKRAVALKVMRSALTKSKDARQRFLREARAIAAIEHRHIVHIYQVGEDRGVAYLAMPFLKGESLETRLKRERKLSVVDAVRIGRQIAEGLAAAHKSELIHRDIKPGNIWLESQDDPGISVKLLDFGLARAEGEGEQTLTQLGTILGTPGYMAPEQARAEKVDARCDLFSLGAVLYRMLTGALPFKGKDPMSALASLLADTPRLVREVNPEVPPSLADLVMRLLAKNPAERPASARAVANTLGAIEDGQSPARNSAASNPALSADERAILDAATRLVPPAPAAPEKAKRTGGAAQMGLRLSFHLGATLGGYIKRYRWIIRIVSFGLTASAVILLLTALWPSVNQKPTTEPYYTTGRSTSKSSGEKPKATKEKGEVKKGGYSEKKWDDDEKPKATKEKGEVKKGGYSEKKWDDYGKK